MQTALLICGLLFTLLSLSTFILSVINSTDEKNVSGIYIPFIGPVLLTIWVFESGVSLWWIAPAWFLDVGTILTLFFLLPMLYRHGRFTRILTLEGTEGKKSLTISLHKGD
jgi:Co/Zn/Cd efflux system component